MGDRRLSRLCGHRSEFLFARVEDCCKLRINRRNSGGIGEKVALICDRRTRFDVSLSVRLASGACCRRRRTQRDLRLSHVGTAALLQQPDEPGGI